MHTRIVSLRREDGQAIVELALVIPLLLVILFGIVDFGLALNQYNDTTNLANLGARAAIVASTTTTSYPSCVSGTTTSSSLLGYLQCEGSLDSSALSCVTVTTQDTTSPGTFATGDTILVKVSSTFNWMRIMFGGIGPLGGSVPSATSTISSTAEMREEANNTSEPAWLSSTTPFLTTPC